MTESNLEIGGSTSPEGDNFGERRKSGESGEVAAVFTLRLVPPLEDPVLTENASTDGVRYNSFGGRLLEPA